MTEECHRALAMMEAAGRPVHAAEIGKAALARECGRGSGKTGAEVAAFMVERRFAVRISEPGQRPAFRITFHGSLAFHEESRRRRDAECRPA